MPCALEQSACAKKVYAQEMPGSTRWPAVCLVTFCCWSGFAPVVARVQAVYQYTKHMEHGGGQQRWQRLRPVVLLSVVMLGPLGDLSPSPGFNPASVQYHTD